MANIQFVFFKVCGLDFAFLRASSNIFDGINFMEIAINNGTIITSSKKPRTGIKSGIKSMGLSRYPTVIPIKIFAERGVLESR